MVPKRFLLYIGLSAAADLQWYPPKQTWINDLSQVINGTGTHGFIFNSSVLPPGTPYGTYNWCNMPHVRRSEYPIPDAEYQLEYVEVIHRHHKRTPYAANTFPHETYSWDCSDAGLFYYGQPLNPTGNTTTPTYWSVYTSETNPFAPTGFNGTCAFPQLTRGGLDDSWQHGQDLYGVYYDLLHFLPSELDPSALSYRVTNNVITSQVASMLISGMYPRTSTSKTNTPLSIQHPSTDSLEPSYTCPAATTLYGAYSVGSTAPNWTAHLTLSAPLFAQLDAISGIDPTSSDWHQSFDHYYDNLSSRQCHDKPLPCSASSNGTNSTDPACVTQDTANTVYRLGQYEYSFIHRDSALSLRAAVGSFGVWIAELAANIRSSVSTSTSTSPSSTHRTIYRHNVAHDGSVSKLLSMLQVDVMVWVGMGAEVVFEVYSKRGEVAGAKRYLRILWGGQVLVSSHPSLGAVDMIDVDVFLDYVDGLVGARAEKVVEFCQS
ncbi:histidine acid phosphatase-like protein [Lophiostoma macrostomum CBS 122681]|uniref:Histidine acid phosphatase-like protein n=1 Tax=Lophiostoma macrostomum CBS 122681 TaxID=1314788 RepID=A0A6A6T1G2_9PLEO|nr:histidine acid phosphatase-like protein [Lophiostoma macrostomum CBS 122681]